MEDAGFFKTVRALGSRTRRTSDRGRTADKVISTLGLKKLRIKMITTLVVAFLLGRELRRAHLEVFYEMHDGSRSSTFERRVTLTKTRH